MLRLAVMLLLGLVAISACAPRAGRELARCGDEIMVAGRLFHTGAPVVLWFDPGGYDAYRVEPRFAPPESAGAGRPAVPRYDRRRPSGGLSGADVLTPEEWEATSGGGWDLPTLQRVVDQVVLHYDAAASSRQCFRILHDVRGLSAHFLVDLDGTIYQTLDVKERAWHATTSNHRSVGIEIAHPGAYPPSQEDLLRRWYAADAGGMRLVLPAHWGDGGVRTPGFVARPARPAPVRGAIHGQELIQYDFTPQQYESLGRLLAALCTVLPRVECEVPRGADGAVVMGRLDDATLASYRGLLGHFHIQENKVDPGPAMDWERVLALARRSLSRR